MSLCYLNWYKETSLSRCLVPVVSWCHLLYRLLMFVDSLVLSNYLSELVVCPFPLLSLFPDPQCDLSCRLNKLHVIQNKPSKIVMQKREEGKTRNVKQKSVDWYASLELFEYFPNLFQGWHFLYNMTLFLGRRSKGSAS